MTGTGGITTLNRRSTLRPPAPPKLLPNQPPLPADRQTLPDALIVEEDNKVMVNQLTFTLFSGNVRGRRRSRVNCYFRFNFEGRRTLYKPHSDNAGGVLIRQICEADFHPLQVAP